MRQVLVFTILMLTLISCKTYSDEDKSQFDQQIRDYLKKEKIDCERSSSGLYYKIIEEGEGEFIRYSDIVSFTYKGTLLNGKVFDEQTEPVEFEVRQLIAAWKEIMLELKPGGKAFLVAPPQLGYGEHKLDDIPQHSILVFELEVKNVR
jgi:FKBP-type peptidyl-prolyl cis-trans isomerase FkpA